MRTKIVVGTALLFAALAISTLGAAPTVKALAVSFVRPTFIAGVTVAGPVVFEHDDARMARGEPCTTVYRYDSKQKDRGEALVSFMCIPHPRPEAKKFEAVYSHMGLGATAILMEYQFEGEREGHGVPLNAQHTH
jgi:hypothetical protein